MGNKRKTFNAQTAALLLVPVALAGCGKGRSSNAPVDAADNASNGETTMLAPGAWKITSSSGDELVRPFGSTPPPIDPSLSPSPEPTERSQTVCITPASAAKITPELLVARAGWDRCEKHYWNVANGTIDGDLTCPGQAEDIREVPVRVIGNYTRERFETEMEYRALGMTLRQKVAGERVGECTGDERP